MNTHLTTRRNRRHFVSGVLAFCLMMTTFSGSSAYAMPQIGRAEAAQVQVSSSSLAHTAAFAGSVQASVQGGKQVKASTQQIKVGAKKLSVSTVRVPKGMKPSVIFGAGQIGKVASLQSIVAQHQARAAVNGTFFEAYGGIPEPWGTVISDGRIEHVGNLGTTIGFKSDGSAKMDTLRVRMTGKVEQLDDGRELDWYAYFVNRTPQSNANSAILFTPKRGKTTGAAFGRAVVVRKGIVTEVASGRSVNIPADGYVIHFTGKEAKLADRFKKGAKVKLDITYMNHQGNEIEGWSDVTAAIGAGPRLVKDGKVALNPKAEGFRQDKILTLSAARSGVGIMPDGSVMIATVRSATMKEWAAAWKQLGAVHAMNLDGGASSGLYANGKLMTKPGRNISNALLFK
ncbi:phosphodiester glycosidase family protein [Paenibacillus sp. 481]|uniref:phosphodiester glycosidase family protein n=1 Tax=Paenibacillus sp. 481 TaxID=2835869 RepID=UPI001E656C8E|nr:phosphodiester glycosidase family protein [Paenibacillus sp. 481]UHA72336.1 phosphodiester glycosidase family protein [Paenibacillus sp. 481]